VRDKASGHKLVRHPELGVLALSFEVLGVTEATGQHVIVYLPADAAAARAARAPALPARRRLSYPKGGRERFRRSSIPGRMARICRVLGAEAVARRAARPSL